MTATTDSPRIEPLQPPYESAGRRAARALDATRSRRSSRSSLFRTLAVHGELMSRMRPLGAGILGSRATVPIGLRELMIDRTCALDGRRVRVGRPRHRVRRGGRASTRRRLRATAAAARAEDCWDPEQSAVLRLAEELHRTSSISDELWARARLAVLAAADDRADRHGRLVPRDRLPLQRPAPAARAVGGALPRGAERRRGLAGRGAQPPARSRPSSAARPRATRLPSTFATAARPDRPWRTSRSLSRIQVEKVV